VRGPETIAVSASLVDEVVGRGVKVFERGPEGTIAASIEVEEGIVKDVFPSGIHELLMGEICLPRLPLAMFVVI
jgi:hypothetical protein